MRTVRQGRCTLPNGVVLEKGTETECGCIFGVDRETNVFVILPCSMTCEVFVYSQEIEDPHKPMGLMAEGGSRKDYDDLVRKTLRLAGRKR